MKTPNDNELHHAPLSQQALQRRRKAAPSHMTWLLVLLGWALCHPAWAATPTNKPTTRPATGQPPTLRRARPTAPRSQPLTRRITVEVQRKTGDITVRFGPVKRIQLKLDGSFSVARWHRSGQRMRLISATGSFFNGDVELTLPRGYNVDVQTFNGAIKIGPGAHKLRAKTLAGDIQAQGVTGSARLRTINGTIKLSDARDGVRASSISGLITLSHTKGPIKATTVSGSITLRHCDTDTLFAQAISGDIDIAHCQIKQGAFKAFSGTIKLAGPFGLRSALVATTSSGDVEIQWPRNVPVSATGTTQSGDNKLPPSVQQRTGTPKLELHTSSGDILWRWMPKAPPKKP